MTKLLMALLLTFIIGCGVTTSTGDTLYMEQFLSFYEQGAEAYRNGKSPTTNPYNSLIQASTYWQQGWSNAKRLAEKQR